MNSKTTKMILIAVQLFFTTGQASAIDAGSRQPIGGHDEGVFNPPAAAGVGCRCVPDQWEGVLVSVEHDFEAHDGTYPFSSETTMSVHYDIINQRFAMHDSMTGSRTVADYRQGYKYVIHGNKCTRIYSNEPMMRMCLPDEAEFDGNHMIGTEVPVGIWHFTSEFNVSTRTTVMSNNCVPISEEIFMVKRAYASVTTSQYIDVTLGVTDESVFVPPSICQRPTRIIGLPTRAQYFEEQQPQQQANHDRIRKRSLHSAASITQAIRDQMKI